MRRRKSEQNRDVIQLCGRKPHAVDVAVGHRIRYRRMVIEPSISQEQLAERASLTYQQVQKYETGKNRVPASRLFQLSQILKVPVGYFFEGAGGPGEVGGN